MTRAARLNYTRPMLLVIPHLFPPARLLQAAAADLRLPALETLLARGTRTPCPAAGVEALVCGALGIPSTQDFPLAAITLQADNGMAAAHYWLRADPVHLRVMRDRIVLVDSSLLNVSATEAAALTLALSTHFGPAFSPLPMHPQRWYLRLDYTPRLRTTPLSCVVGCDIDPLLPSGDDAMTFRTLLNELQMLLHEHPVNQAREVRGELPVNSLWLWGGGVLPSQQRSALSLYSDDAESRALGQFCAASVQNVPGAFSTELLRADTLIVLNQLTASGQYGDAYGWRDAVRALEHDWFVPLLKAHRKWPDAGLQLQDPINGASLRLTRADAWKVWRRPQAIWSPSQEAGQVLSCRIVAA